MWGQSVPSHLKRLYGCHGASKVVQCPAALQELFEIFPEDRPAMLQVAGERGDWRQVLALHAQSVDETPFEEKGELYRNTATNLVSAQQWNRALRLIEEFREQCSPSQFWENRIGGLMLSVYSRWGSWPEILQVLQEGQTYPDTITASDRCEAMLALAQQDWQRALEVMEMSRGFGERGKETYIAGMNAWASGRHWEKVFDMFREIEETLKDKDVFEGALSACYKLCRSDDNPAPVAAAMSFLIREMCGRSMPPSDRYRNMAMMVNARAGYPEDALRLLLEAQELGTSEVESSSFRRLCQNCMRAFRQAGDWRHALLLLEEIPEDPYSFEEALKACAQCGEWQWSVELVEQMQARYLPVQQATHASLVTTYSNAKQWKPALWSLEEAERSTPAERRTGATAVNMVSLYNKVITSFAKEGEWRRALQLLHEMPGKQVQPDVVTYGAVSTTCNRARHYLYSLQLQEDMMQKDINPDVSSFKTAVAACRGKMQLLLEAAKPGQKRRQKLL